MHEVRFQRILCPVDFSPLSSHAVAYADSLARTYGASLHVLHVVDEAYQYWMAMGPNSVPVGPPPEELERAARDGMVTFLKQYLPNPPAGLATEVRLGRPFVEIVRYARDTSADLIVIGTHGRSGLSHVLLGSVTEKVVRKAHCPVLTVRSPDQKFEMP